MDWEARLETKFAKIRRISGEVFSQLLNVPILSGLLAVWFFPRLPASEPNRMAGFIWSLVFLTFVPALSYFFYIPFKKDSHGKTLHRQRVASFVMMIISYPLGWFVLARIHAPLIFTATLEIYTFVTLGLILFNLIFHYKASGHAAGVSGPVASLIFLYGLAATPLFLLLPLVTWARVAAKGHNVWQTVVGGVLSMLIAVAVLWGLGFHPFSGILW